MSRPVGIFLAWLLPLALISLLLAAWWLSFRFGPELSASAVGIGAGAVGAALSYILSRRTLDSSQLTFLRAYFGGLALRFVLLALAGFAVWGLARWSLKHYLIAVALTYPFFLIVEAWRLSRDLASRRRDETAQDSRVGE